MNEQKPYENKIHYTGIDIHPKYHSGEKVLLSCDIDI